jgi:FtsP/CotA-like multicopper oxidase with cupredoxin domain
MYDAEEVIFLQDWYHLNGPALQAGLDSIPFIWVGNPQSFAINGGALYLPCYENTTSDPSQCDDNCSIENYIKTIEVESGKTYRLRIIGAQILIGVNFAIRNHTMTVVEVDGTLCEPFEVSNLDVMPGEFSSIEYIFYID